MIDTLAGLVVLFIAGYWVGPMNRDDGWPEPRRQKLVERQAHACGIDPGIFLARELTGTLP